MKYFLMIVSFFIIVGCSGEQTPEEPSEESNQHKTSSSDVSISFGILDVVTKDDVIHVDGEARTTEDSFYYILEYGETLIVEETEVQLNDDDGEWKTFSFEVNIADEELTNEENTLLTLYSKEDQEVVNPNYIPVDLMIY